MIWAYMGIRYPSIRLHGCCILDWEFADESATNITAEYMKRYCGGLAQQICLRSQQSISCSVLSKVDKASLHRKGAGRPCRNRSQLAAVTKRNLRTTLLHSFDALNFSSFSPIKKLTEPATTIVQPLQQCVAMRLF